jgi:hypothetical protein
MYTSFELEHLKGRDNSEELYENERIILKWILKKHGVVYWIKLVQSKV